MIHILHNPRCQKSREGVAFLEEKNVDFKTRTYLNDTLSKKELESIIEKLNISPIELVRKNEAIWKSNFKSKNLTDAEIIDAMVANPKLIERPIIINKNKAVVGRPVEAINNIL